MENTAGAGTTDSCPFYIDAGATGSALVRNIALGWSAGNYTVNCFICDIEIELGGAAGATNPWANLSF